MVPIHTSLTSMKFSFCRRVMIACPSLDAVVKNIKDVTIHYIKMHVLMLCHLLESHNPWIEFWIHHHKQSWITKSALEGNNTCDLHCKKHTPRYLAYGHFENQMRLVNLLFHLPPTIGLPLIWKNSPPA